MTLSELVVGGGVVSSLALVPVLSSLWPTRRHRCVFTMSTRSSTAYGSALVRSSSIPLVSGSFQRISASATSGPTALAATAGPQP